MSLATKIKEATPRHFVLTALGACQLAEHAAESKHAADPKLVGLAIGGVFLEHLGAHFFIEWFHRLTDGEFDSVDQVIAEAIGRICAKSAPEIGDVRARWKTLAKMQRAELKELTEEEVVPLLAWHEAPPYEEMV